MTKTNFGKFREQELVGTNGVINEFMRAFDLELLNYMSNEDKPVGAEVRDYYDINEAGQKFLLNLKDDILTFRDDYYAMKSTIDIAKRIDLNVETVYPYVKYRTFSKEGYNITPVKTFVSFKDFNPTSKVYYLSSFQILRDIQMDDRFNKLKKKN
ncbi:hypothetical protein [Lacinutrix himadriensis]|uniref:hypothetical protein n=1 Tax=Lacinutrix himadriensis TaxID=641549 RepID=UPI0006E133CE|nr:hypothetical protein [Lacinutrix himadriensis]